jgi:SAM-dependent methyltransferase
VPDLPRKPRSMTCVACGSSAIGHYLVTAAGEVLRCKTCSLVFLSPEGRDDRAEDLYSQDYFTEREGYFFRDGVVDGSGQESPHVADFRHGLQLIETQRRPPGRLLDVGCATGSFLSLAQQRGWDCRGVEVSSFAAAKARDRTGVEVFCGQFEDAPFPDASFDVITMWDLFEHLPAPPDALRRVRQLLRPGGLVLVNTPNENSLIRGLSRLLYRGSGGTIRGPVDRLYHRYHVTYFGAASLARLVDSAGLESMVMQTKGIPLSRGRISPAVKVMMRALGVVERLAKAEYELILLARRPA